MGPTLWLLADGMFCVEGGVLEPSVVSSLYTLSFSHGARGTLSVPICVCVDIFTLVMIVFTIVCGCDETVMESLLPALLGVTPT